METYGNHKESNTVDFYKIFSIGLSHNVKKFDFFQIIIPFNDKPSKTCMKSRKFGIYFNGFTFLILVFFLNLGTALVQY